MHGNAILRSGLSYEHLEGDKVRGLTFLLMLCLNPFPHGQDLSLAPCKKFLPDSCFSVNMALISIGSYGITLSLHLTHLNTTQPALHPWPIGKVQGLTYAKSIIELHSISLPSPYIITIYEYIWDFWKMELTFVAVIAPRSLMAALFKASNLWCLVITS